MGLIPRSLLVVQCNMCKRELGFEDDVDDVDAVFETKEEAIEMAEGCDWFVLRAQEYFRCPSCNDIVIKQLDDQKLWYNS